MTEASRRNPVRALRLRSRRLSFPSNPRRNDTQSSSPDRSGLDHHHVDIVEDEVSENVEEIRSCAGSQTRR